MYPMANCCCCCCCCCCCFFCCYTAASASVDDLMECRTGHKTRLWFLWCSTHSSDRFLALVCPSMAASLLLLEENQRAIWGVYDAVSLFSVLTTMARHKDPVEVLLTRVRSVSMAGWGGGDLTWITSQMMKPWVPPEGEKKNAWSGPPSDDCPY